MLTCRWNLLLAGLALWGCRSQTPAVVSSQPPQKQSLSQPQGPGGRSAGAALRVPSKGGAVRLYRLPSLVEVPNALRGRLPAVDRVVGLDPESDFLFVRTAVKEVLALDLESGRVDTVATGSEQATLGPDGTLYTVDAKRRVVSLARRVRFAWPQALSGQPRELFGAADQRLVAVVAQEPPRLMVTAADQPPASRPLPPGGDVAATRWGDLVAIASDSGVTVMDPLGRRQPTHIPLADNPRALVFSPSGHRIYVARRNGAGLAVIDRFERREIDGVALPAPAAAIRLDPFGRWLLAKPVGGDSAWIVDLPVKALVGALATSWRVDLPAVAPDGSLLLRQGGDVVAYRPPPDSLRETGRLAGAGDDLWVLTAWGAGPQGGYRGPVLAAGPTNAAAPAAGAAPTIATESPGAEVPLYVQVSTSQSQAWSTEMAQQLSRAGLAAHVLPPAGPDDGYHVVLGPYPTRAQAEAIGRKLGRPFWIFQPTP